MGSHGIGVVQEGGIAEHRDVDLALQSPGERGKPGTFQNHGPHVRVVVEKGPALDPEGHARVDPAGDHPRRDLRRDLHPDRGRGRGRPVRVHHRVFHLPGPGSVQPLAFEYFSSSSRVSRIEE